MTRHSVQTRNQIFVKGYGFLNFAKNMSKNTGKNISKNLSCKYSQKLIDHAKQSATDAFKTASKRAIQKTVETAGNLNGNKIVYKITKVSKSSRQNSTERVEIPKERKIYIYIYSLVNLYIYGSPFHLATAQSLWS